MPKLKTPTKDLDKMLAMMFEDLTIKKITKFIASNLVVSMTAKVYKAEKKRKCRARNYSDSFIVKFGRPNYLEREFIKSCIKANEPLPVRKLQIKYL